MGVTNKQTLDFMMKLKNNKDFKFDNQENLKLVVKNYDKDTIMATLDFDNNKSPGVAMSDLHIGFLISKLNCVNMSELNLASKIRMSKLKNVKLPTETELPSVLKRLCNAGILCQQVITGPQHFYFTTSNGRKFINHALGNKNVRDLDFYEVRDPNELLGEAAVTYVALSLIREGYTIRQNRIISINYEVNRFPAVLNNENGQVVIDKLYLRMDSSTTTEEEYAYFIKRKIQKICHYLKEKEKDKAVLVCNDMMDIQVMFSFLSEPKLAELFEAVSDRVFFTSVSNVKSAEVLTDSLARFELMVNADGGLKAGDNCIFDFKM